ncbi:condensin complex subunit 2 like protein [Babesia gibsoni]|uniref:Condensin complex subunit 2 n=1 Tax=Babesia gibsoni TaxID=33632 RepID=A0AAD8LSH9_BABGI|nr:condensin complex subunit 2 like protein [Babesia gibsoni]
MGETTHKLSAKKRIRPSEDADALAPNDQPGHPPKKTMNKVSSGPSDNSQELLSLFTDCMSALSTNKIGSQNAFDVGIIDHMNDLVNLDGGSDDEEDAVDDALDDGTDAAKNKRLNFTRASKVVESASKIYGYRIEAVYDLTFNVLMNMNNANTQDSAGPASTTTKARTRTKGKMEFNFGTNTLASESDVTLTEIPVDNVVLDPYFLKISSMFDQSGAQGLLLTNLQVSNDLALNLDGDNLVFTPDEPSKGNSCELHVSCAALKDHVKKTCPDFTKLEIIPEIAYFKQELQRLLGLKSSRKEPKEDVPETTETETTAAADIEPDGESEAIGMVSDLALDDIADGGIAPMPDGDLSLNDLDLSSLNYDGMEPMYPQDDSALGGPDAGGMDMGDGPAHAPVPQRKAVSATFIKRLASLDLVRGSEFSYYTTNLKDMTGQAVMHDGAGEEGGAVVRRERQSKQKSAMYRDLVGYMNSNSTDAEIESIKCITSGQVSKPPQKKARSIFSAIDGTTHIFKFNDVFLTHLGTLSNRTMRISSECDWRIKNIEDNKEIPILQIYYAKDMEASYVFMRIHENFSWKDDEVVDIRIEETSGIMGGVGHGGGGEDMDGMEVGMDYIDDIATSLANMDPEPIEESIDKMYEMDAQEPSWSLTTNQVGVGEPDLGLEPTKGPGGIVPANLAAYVDIFKIKKTLCGVILPPPDFQEAVEDEKALDETSKEETASKETGCMFQHAITQTVNQLHDNDLGALTSHIMFVCLLHVCNEQDLLLRQNAALEDFHIAVDAPKQHHLGDYSKSITT